METCSCHHRRHGCPSGRDVLGARRAMTRRLRLPTSAACCVAAMVALTLPAGMPSAQVRLPSIGDAAAEDFPAGLERRYGEQIMREVWRDPAYLDDPLLDDYVRSLWALLVKAARDRGDIDPDLHAQLAWKTFLVRDRSVNAFALPGGYVGVHLGLIAMTNSAGELASVLAHELSHVSQRHIARSIASANRQNTASIAAMLLGILAASRSGSADLAQAAIAGSQAAALQGQLNFSRDMEREADRIGFGVFEAAGFGVEGMSRMFEKLDQAGRLNDSGAFPYLRSHPLTAERIAEARARAMVGGRQGNISGPLHGMMQARARILMEATDDAWRTHLDAAANEGNASTGQLYAAALAAQRLRDPVGAMRWLEVLRQRLAKDGIPVVDPSWGVVDMLEAEQRLDRGQAEEALALLRRPSVAGSRAALLLSAAASLRLGTSRTEDLRRADQSLRTWLAEHREDAAAWSAQARISEALGHRLHMLRAQAEERAALGDLGAAIDRLRAAQRLYQTARGAELVDASIIDARLRDMETRRRWLEGAGRQAGSARPG